MATNQLTETQMLQGLQSSDVNEVYKCLADLRSNYVCNVDKMRKMTSKHSVLKKVISHLEHPKFCNLALSIVSNCSNDEYLRCDIIKNNGIVPLARTLKGLANDEILNRACRALANIALSDEGLLAVIKSDIITNIVSLLNSASVEDHKLTCIRALRIMGRKKEHRTHLVRSNAIFTVASLITNGSTNVVAASAKALALLTQNCTANVAQQIVNVNAEILLKLVALNKQEEDKYLAYNALTILENLTLVSAMREELCDAGVLPLFIKVANSPDTIKNKQSAVLALCFCCGVYYGKKQIRELGGLDSLVNILRNSRYENIHMQIITALIQMCSELDNPTLLRKLGLYEILVEKLKTVISKHKPHVEYKALLKLSSKTSNVESVVKDHPEGSRKISVDSPKSTHNANNSTVFSIHSPTYQGVQYSDSSAPPPTYSYYMGGGSPLSTQLSSPECYSFEWSPSSPKSCSSPMIGPWSPGSSSNDVQDACWSPLMSSRSLTPDSSDSNDTNEPKSNQKQTESDNVQDSGASTSSIKDDSTISNNPDKSKVIINKFDDSSDPLQANESSSEGLLRNQPEKQCVKKCKRKLLEEEDNLKSVMPECIRQLIHGTREKDTPKPKKPLIDHPDKQLVNCILILLSQLTRILINAPFWNIAEDLDLTVFAEYLAKVSPANVRIMTILKNLISSPHCFKSLVSVGFFRKVHNLMEAPHSEKKCDHCSTLAGTRLAVHRVAETMICKDQFAISVLKNVTQSDNWETSLNGFETLSRFINMHRTLAIHFGEKGLVLFGNVLNNTNDDDLFELASHTLGQIWNNMRIRDSSGSDSTNINDVFSPCAIYCRYTFLMDSLSQFVELVANDETRILAARNLLCERSEYFSSLLSGQFLEAKQDVVSLSSVDSQILTCIVHYLHGCRMGWCPNMTEIPLTEIHKLMQASDMFLLDSLKGHMVKSMLKHMPTSNADAVLLLVKNYGTEKDLKTFLTNIFDVGSSLSPRFIECISCLLKNHNQDILVFFKNFLHNTIWSFPFTSV